MCRAKAASRGCPAARVAAWMPPFLINGRYGPMPISGFSGSVEPPSARLWLYKPIRPASSAGSVIGIADRDEAGERSWLTWHANGDRCGRAWVVRSGNATRFLIAHPYPTVQPRRSPDSERIAFIPRYTRAMLADNFLVAMDSAAGEALSQLIHKAPTARKRCAPPPSLQRMVE